MTSLPTEVWAIAGTRLREPYPCRCHERKYGRCSPKYCPCHGRTDLDDPAVRAIMADDCCAMERWAREREAELEVSQPAPPPGELDRAAVRASRVDPMAGNAGYRESVNSAKERIAHAERASMEMCERLKCRLPQSQTLSHCPECHRNYTPGAFQAHQRPVRAGSKPCLDPQTTRIVGTDRRLFVWSNGGWALNTKQGEPCRPKFKY